MSEQINKVLASTAQSFTTAQQAQARDNIGAIGYANLDYSGSAITGIGGSAVGAQGGISAVEHEENFTGSGTSSYPLGLARRVVVNVNNVSWGTTPGTAYIGSGCYPYPNHLTGGNYAQGCIFGLYENDSAASIHNSTALIFCCPANGIGGGVTTSLYKCNGWDISYSNEDSYIKQVKLTTSGNYYENLGNTACKSIYGFGSALFTDDTGNTWESVDASSIRQWKDGYTKFQSLSAWATAQGWTP